MRPTMRWVVVLTAATTLVVGACSDAESTPKLSPPTTDTTAPIDADVPTGVDHATTSSPPPPTVPAPIDLEVAGPGPQGVQIYLPADPVDAPIVMLVHGGGWLAGSPLSMEPLGRALAERGAIVFNASYRTDRNGGGYPATFEDIACAVAFTRHHSEELGASGPISLVGHSAGAHIATVVAISADSFIEECPFEESPFPERVVGLAGIYRLEAVTPIMERFLGGDARSAPEAWEAADPFLHLDELADVDFLLVHGTADRIAPPSSSQDLADALSEAGAAVDLELVEGGSHNGVLDPGVVAELIAP